MKEIRYFKMQFLLLFVMVAQLHVMAQHNVLDSLQDELNRAKEDSTRVKLLLNIGDKQGLDSALYSYNQALALAKNIHYQNGVYESLASMSMVYRLKGDYEDAILTSLEFIQKAEKERDTLTLFYAYRSILFSYNDLSDSANLWFYRNKIKTLYESGFLQRKGPSKTLTGETFINNNTLGKYYTMTGNTDSALYYIRLNYQAAVKQDWPQWIGISTPQFYGLLPLDSSIYYLKIGIHASLVTGRYDNAGSALVRLSTAYSQIGDPDSALLVARQALAIANEEDFPILKLEATRRLYEEYEKMENRDSAYVYLSEWATINNTLFGQERVSKIQSLNINERIRVQQEAQAEIALQQKKASNTRFFSALAVALLLLVLVIIYFRNSRLRRKANDQLEKAYNDLKATQSQLIHSEKMASLGELTAGIAHEIQNPLNFVNNFSEVSIELIEELAQESAVSSQQSAVEIINDITQNLQKINFHGKRADAIVKSMLQHSRTSKGNKELTDINALADEYLRLSYHGMRAMDKSFNAGFSLEADENLPEIMAVPQDIGRVLLNLINNAFYAVSEKAKQNIKAYQPEVVVSTKLDGGKIELRVMDNGDGIPAEIKEKIFQPFFTTKPTGKGTGLGLSMSFDIITKGHAGTLDVVSKEGEGTEFIIKLNV